MNIARAVNDSRRAFTDRVLGLRKQADTGQHESTQLCANIGNERRLTPPMRPQTIGMVERFNGRMRDVLQSQRFKRSEDIDQTIVSYIVL